MQWEQRVVHTASTNWLALDELLQRIGAEGWEAVGIAGSDQPLGYNALMAVVRRAIVPPPPPPEGSPTDWYADPCGRWEKRYWNGHVWTAHVADVAGKRTAIDPPQTLPATAFD